MTAAEIRRSFLEYFERNGHAIRPSSSLVPSDDPTLLFTNAGMVQFKRAFLGEEDPGFARATTSQKCLRVSGKHNDLEEVGRTARHHTFFEMLGNFSFGDYFKRDAVHFAWEFMTEELGLDPERLFATVHYTDDEAAELWQDVAGLPATRIFRLGDKDNFWQMGDTGPCGPCSELHYDLRSDAQRGTDLAVEEFVERGEAGEFLELWNLVFMQFDRSADGSMEPLPKPSIDTGAGLERIAAVLQGVASNYETDLFRSLIDRAVQVVGTEYDPGKGGVSYRVLADHARAVAFLLADGVFPTNEGRGYVLRRILRRAVRHAWLLGRREATLVEVVNEVVEGMGGAFPELVHRRDHILRATRTEEERFLSTIDAGMDRFDEVAPVGGGGTITGEDAFRLYDTYGFPLDLTELMAEERGFAVDVDGFEAALEEQRERSRKDRAVSAADAGDALAQGWEELERNVEQEFVGYRETDVETEVTALRREDGRAALELRRNPFYVEAGGQVSDSGTVEGDGWSLVVDDVRHVAGRVAVLGDVDGEFPAGETKAPIPVRARVAPSTRHDTERNHTATHLLHAALRQVLGDHVVQRGSLVAPDRLRFDFSHPQPMTGDELGRVEDIVNGGILADHEVVVRFMGHDDALAEGAMALFGEKYGDTVRTITIPGISMELCGGTHVRHTSEIGMFRITSETGVGAGVRRIEAMTGPAAYGLAREHEERLQEAANLLKTPPDMLVRRIEQILEEHRDLERQLAKVRLEGAADLVGELVRGAEDVDGVKVVAHRVDVASMDELRALGDRLRDQLGSGAVVLAGAVEGAETTSLLAVVTDDLISRGVRANDLVRLVAKSTGGSGGGRPHMAQGGVGDPERLQEALAQALGRVRELLAR